MHLKHRSTIQCESIRFFSVKETDWSIEMANEIVSNVWECEKCKFSFNITGMQRLRHIMGKSSNYPILYFDPKKSKKKKILFFKNAKPLTQNNQQVLQMKMIPSTTPCLESPTPKNSFVVFVIRKCT